ncbi:hypothetical protein PHLCEN_2v11005 [Hermanssonia centrifuga]|uniref:Uncharacterized protein n=1 Tax=Hermanssonia centrifuga TaxID=98765 RepID=A0A2R6NL83_9APHY|nr:hypothetical protein PHLCEN_2v11005 [Hermanssonia centrifuga]
MIDVDTGSAQFYIFYFIPPSTTGPNAIVHVEIVAIDVRDYKGGDSDKWSRTCEQLPHLQRLVLGFRSREDMTRFVREVVNTKLDDLHSADRVKYAVITEDGMWFQASVDSEEVKEIGFEENELWRI